MRVVVTTVGSSVRQVHLTEGVKPLAAIGINNLLFQRSSAIEAEQEDFLVSTEILKGTVD